MTRNNKRNTFTAETDGFKTVTKSNDRSAGNHGNRYNNGNNNGNRYVNNSYNRAPKAYTGPEDVIRPINKITTHMINRLSPLINAYNSCESILASIGHPGAKTTLSEYATDFPYYRMSDVCRVFDFGSVLPGHAFEICEMLIINGNIFLSIVGIYKALILSDISPFEKFMFLQEIDSTDFDISWTSVNNMQNNPLPTINSAANFAEKYVRHNLFYGNPEINMPYLTQLLLRAQHFAPLDTEFFKSFKENTVRSHTGCILQGKKHGFMYSDNDCQGVAVSSNNGLRYIAGKYRPIIKKHSTDTLTALKVLCAHRARSFVSAIFANDSRYYLYDNSEVFKMPGFIYLNKDETIRIGDGMDDSTNNDVAAACMVHYTPCINKCIEHGWSFDQLVSQHVM